MEPQKRKPKVRMFRFLRCFNPNGVVSRERKTPDPLLTYIAVPEKHMLPTVLTSAFKTAKGGEGNASHRKKTDRDKNDDSNNNSNRSFRRALMSALNHTSLVSLCLFLHSFPVLQSFYYNLLFIFIFYIYVIFIFIIKSSFQVNIIQRKC